MIGVRENRISFALGFGFKILRKTCLSVCVCGGSQYVK